MVYEGMTGTVCVCDVLCMYVCGYGDLMGIVGECVLFGYGCDT